MFGIDKCLVYTGYYKKGLLHCTLFKVRFIQDSCLFGFSLYRILVYSGSVYTGFWFIQVQFIQDSGLFRFGLYRILVYSGSVYT